MADRPITRRVLLGSIGAGAFTGIHRSRAATSTVALDYAYYNPLSLVVRDQRLVEAALGGGASVTWVLSAGSNKALEYLRGGSIAFGSTAGSAALLGRINGAPTKIAAIYAEAEWTALLTKASGPIKRVADLRACTVAATPGTDPAIFLLRALDAVGLSRRDIRLVPLQHSAGRQALDSGEVDAWAGLDPFMAEAEIENHDRLFFRDRALISPGTLLVREDVAAHSPELVHAVLGAYEQARLWAVAHPEQLAGLLAREAHLPLEVANRQLGRTRFPGLAVVADQRARIEAASDVLVRSGSISSGADPKAALASLYTG